MTQQYLIGQFSVLLEELRPIPGDGLAGAVCALRREVESAPVQMLPLLAHEAMDLTDVLCWAALERGDREGFRRCADSATALGDFTECAGLMSE